MNLFVTCGAALMMIAPAVSKLSAEERFAEAQSLFDDAKRTLAEPDGDTVAGRRQFHEAAQKFAALARDGVRSVNLYVNTGNAFHFAGDEPRALLWYLRANRLANTAETRNGLVALRNACGAKPWPHDTGSVGRALLFWHYDLGRPTKHWILIATYPLGCIVFLAAWFTGRRPAWKRLGLALMVIGATMGISDLFAATTGDGRWAVVVESGKGYAGDGEGYSIVVDRITPGQEVKVVESRDEWMQVKLPSGATCWIEADICEVV